MFSIRGTDPIEEEGNYHCLKSWYAYLEINNLEGSLGESNWMRIQVFSSDVVVEMYNQPNRMFLLNKDNKTKKDLGSFCHKAFQPLEKWRDEPISFAHRGCGLITHKMGESVNRTAKEESVRVWE